jgi:hypothetical protein
VVRWHRQGEEGRMDGWILPGLAWIEDRVDMAIREGSEKTEQNRTG